MLYIAAISYFFLLRCSYTTGVAITAGSVGGIIFPLMLQRTVSLGRLCLGDSIYMHNIYRYMLFGDIAKSRSWESSIRCAKSAKSGGPAPGGPARDSTGRRQLGAGLGIVVMRTTRPSSEMRIY
jgi:hypothetical protein